jgi:hypothetical protein
VTSTKWPSRSVREGPKTEGANARRRSQSQKLEAGKGLQGEEPRNRCDELEEPVPGIQNLLAKRKRSRPYVPALQRTAETAQISDIADRTGAAHTFWYPALVANAKTDVLGRSPFGGEAKTGESATDRHSFLKGKA